MPCLRLRVKRSFVFFSPVYSKETTARPKESRQEFRKRWLAWVPVGLTSTVRQEGLRRRWLIMAGWLVVMLTR